MAAIPPTVVFPGVMGSRLFFTQSRRFWDPDRGLRMAWWVPVWGVRTDDDNRKALHVREPAAVVLDTKDVTPEQRDRGWSTVVWGFYGKLLDRLARETGGEVFAAGYDWRQDIRELGRFAAGKIRQFLTRSGADTINIVTHSMGGLVLRAALHPEIGKDLHSHIGRVIHVCQPSVGAVVLYRRLFTGLLPELDGTGSIADRVFRVLLGSDRKAFVGNMSGLPGPLQLLPTRYFPAPPGRAWHSFFDNPAAEHGELYPSTISPPGLVPGGLGLSDQVVRDLRKRLKELAAFEAFLGDPAAPPPTEAWLIYGTGLDTEVRVDSGKENAPDRLKEGDGVVPVASATALRLAANRMIPVAKLTHADACQDQRVQDHVLDILAGPAGRSLAPPSAAAPAAVNGEADVVDWLRSARAVAARLGARVRVTIEVDPPRRGS